ncbi:MAG TPA: hypothetical protein VIW68_12695 [Candidatus Sulfotelmatobacter sp.]
MSVLDTQNKQVDIEMTGGLLTDIPTADVPPGISPNNQDCDYLPRAAVTRYGTGPGVFNPIAGNPTVNYLKSYEQPSLIESLLALDSAGTLWQSVSMSAALSSVGSVLAGTFGKSCTLFGQEWIGLSDGKFGLDIPRRFDGQYFDRVSQVGPGAPPAVADSGAAGNVTVGIHQLVVLFVTRSGYITKPSPPTSWNAAGSKEAAVTNIPIGPPNVVARIIAFTIATGATWFYLPTMVINDNTTTTLTIDFTDTALIGGTPIALLFNNQELGEVAGFLPYANRLIAWGERNKLFNLLNMTFDGGFGYAGSNPVVTPVGPNSPTVGVDRNDIGGLSPWIGPGNVFALDGVVATNNIPSVSLGDALQATGYGFAIPGGASIRGIVVTAYVAGSPGTVRDSQVFLVKTGGTIVGTNHAGGSNWGSFIAPRIYGAANDLWGTTWTPADINAAGFGVLIGPTAGGGGATAQIDYISITVYYSTGGTGAGVVPLGWSAGASAAGSGDALAMALLAYWGDAYAITGDGATAVRGQINQSAYQDYLGVQIIKPNTAYKVRVRLARNAALLAGTVHINLQSTSAAFTTAGLAVTAAQLGTGYVEFISFLTDAPLTAVPADLLIQVYADGTPTNGGTFLIDDIEVFPANVPYLATQARASTVDDPETFDGVNGLLEPTTSRPVRTAFVITDRSELLANDHLYLVCEGGGIWRTQDNGGDPSTWGFSRVSDTVGTPSINGVDVGEDWVVIADPAGLYLYYFGTEPTKISQEVQAITANSPATVAWDQVNWSNGQRVWVKVDIQSKRILVGAPIGAATAPSNILMMNFRGLETSTAIIGTPPMRPSYTGKFIAQAIGRKWSPWTISANCCWIEPKDTPLGIPAPGTGAIFLGNAVGNGKIYNQSAANGFLDDGVNIPAFYDTSFVPSQEQKEQFGMLGSLCLLSYLRAHIQGSGNVTFTFFGPDYVDSASVPIAATPGVPNQTPKTPAAPAIVLSSPAKNDIESYANFIGERMNVRIQAAGAPGSGPWFSAQKLELFVQPNPTGALRGFN